MTRLEKVSGSTGTEEADRLSRRLHKFRQALFKVVGNTCFNPLFQASSDSLFTPGCGTVCGMARYGTSEMEAALLDAIRHARAHHKNEIALSLAFALERHRLGGARPHAKLDRGDRAMPHAGVIGPWVTPSGGANGR